MEKVYEEENQSNRPEFVVNVRADTVQHQLSKVFGQRTPWFTSGLHFTSERLSTITTNSHKQISKIVKQRTQQVYIRPPNHFKMLVTDNNRMRILTNRLAVFGQRTPQVTSWSCLCFTFRMPVNSLCTKDHISGPTAHNVSVLRTAYAIYAFKNLQQISHMVCTKQMILAPFHNLLSVQV